MASPSAIFEEGFGKEPESLWGVLENIEADEVSVRKAMYVFGSRDRTSALINNQFASDGLRQNQAPRSTCSKIWRGQLGTEESLLSNGRRLLL